MKIFDRIRFSGRLPAAFLLSMLVTGCSPEYVLRGGWEELKILTDMRPIEEVVADPATDEETRQKLLLVRDARVYAERRLGLDAGTSFRNFARLDGDTLVLVVSAAPEFELRWKTWWFPIVGDVPYKGFFHFDDARKEAARLEAEGYDVYLRPSAAFSTLGWLPDPVLSTSLAEDSIGLVETVIHEITHTTFYPKGEARFNESFANFVGWRGAIEFFCDGLADAERCATAEGRWRDLRTFGEFFNSVVEPLEALYASGLSETEMRAEKQEILDEAAERFETEYRPRFVSGRYRSLDRASLDNAWLLSRLLYYTRLDDFEILYESYPDLASAVGALIEAAGDEDPWQALDALLVATDEPVDAGAQARAESAGQE
ncbi:MAG: aminopeptidase [marine benthic group bacterium]|nr:aminopeptidase [Candidatus Carthagonibacter metallireducens]